MKRLLCLICLMMSAALSLALCGCKKSVETGGDYVEDAAGTDAGFRRTVLYYGSEDGHIVPVMKSIPWEEGIGRAALSYMVASPDNDNAASALGLHTLIPEGTQISLGIDSGEAVVDLAGLPELSEQEGRAMLTAVVNTLVEFPSIECVSVTLDGKAADALPGGVPLSQSMEALPLNVENGAAQASTGTLHALTLYFSNDAGSLNIPVTRYMESSPTVTGALEELIKGTETAGLLSCFPEGTRVLDAAIEGDAASVTLSSEFLDDAYTDGLALCAYETMLLTLNKAFGAHTLDVYVDKEVCRIEGAPASAPLYANEWR